MRRAALRIAVVLAVGSMLAACAETKLATHAVKQVPWDERGTYKVGKPYRINGVWYYPAEDYDYDEAGIASWYGRQFHGKETANGEVFDMNEVTAAHRTLPMPSFARVTNLENGRSIVVRINDRGPYAHGRIIDLSRRSAQLLGFESQGTAKVRVQILAEESRTLAMRLQGREDDNRSRPAAAPRIAVAAEMLPALGSTETARPITTPVQHQRSVMSAQSANPADPAQLVQTQSVRTGNLYVQAGSFQQYDNANRVGARLSGIGKPAIVQAKVAGNDVFRVRMGPFGSVDEADKLLERVINIGYPDAQVVVD